ncbi:SKI/DACH domain-containing protein 1-like [Macrobrachium nipponense]|uniref:SKI/DACH domain-containing protein 1-like n=1 Tax=Macrobrachium nipponense TaxID=159736 RepID=UPI0030C8C551
MSRSAVVMQGQVKVEVQSPVKPDVLKPSNAANLQNIPTKTPKALSISAKDTAVGRTVLGSNKNVIGKVSLKIQQQVNGNPRSGSLRSSPSSVRSPHKSLTPIRPSPTVKLSTSTSRSPSSPYVRTPTSVSRVAAPSSVGLGSSGISTPSPAKCRRRISYSDGGGDVPLPVSRRNARERNRVKMVSQGFAILRQHVPHAARKKKLSKVETLRCAVEYIRGLQLLLDTHPTVVVSSSSSSSPTSSSHHHPPAIHSDHHHHHHHHLHHLHQGVMGPTSSASPSNTNALSSTAASYQQLHPQVFLHPHHGIEPHILKLPTAEDTYQSIGQMRYDGPDGAFLRTSPCDSSDVSPTNSFYEQKFTPPGTGAASLATTTTSPAASTISSSSSTSSTSSTSPSSSLPLGVVKTEENEEMRNYGREEQDLLEALAWWQHNIN